jgi:trans-2,3-dihydro-3-hydroxyanthranilate isomerase
MKISYPYRIVDVFTNTPLEGNALAVFPQAQGLDTPTMQKIAKEMNLAETSFVFPATRPDCAAQVRIFTPVREMLFAGHPTVGTSFVLLDEGIVPPASQRFVLEEKIGPVPVEVERGERTLIWLITPPIREGPVFSPEDCAEMLSLATEDLLGPPPQLVTAGNPTLFIALKGPEAVDRAELDNQGWRKIQKATPEPVCIFPFAPTAAGAYSRMFAPDHGVVEDPATGSATGPLAFYMMRHGLVADTDGHRFVSEQGTRMGRRSILHIEVRGKAGKDGIAVGGEVTPVARGVLEWK